MIDRWQIACNGLRCEGLGLHAPVLHEFDLEVLKFNEGQDVVLPMIPMEEFLFREKLDQR
jgi:hypothetical protein